MVAIGSYVREVRLGSDASGRMVLRWGGRGNLDQSKMGMSLPKRELRFVASKRRIIHVAKVQTRSFRGGISHPT
jgi:hypothetical protein